MDRLQRLGLDLYHIEGAIAALQRNSKVMVEDFYAHMHVLGGEVTLAASVDESGALRLSVPDNGIGISEENLPNISGASRPSRFGPEPGLSGYRAWAIARQDDEQIAWRQSRS